MKKVLLLLTLAVAGCTAAFAEMAGGTLATGATWSISDDGTTLTFTGEGYIPDYFTLGTAPWYPYATSIETVQIGDEIDDYGMFAFYGCDNLTNIFVDEGNRDLQSIDGVLFYTPGDELIYFPPGRSGSYTVPDCTEDIYESSFIYCTKLTEVIINDNVTNIGDGAFQGCASLKRVVLPNNDHLRLATKAFGDCSSLEDITITNGVTNLLRQVFVGCTSLTEFKITPDHPTMTVVDGALLSKDHTLLFAVPNGKTGEYVIPESVNDVDGTNGLLGCVKLTSISVPQSLNKFPDISSCTMLESILIADDNPNFKLLDGVVYNADMTQLVACPPAYYRTNLNIPEGVTALTDYCLANCTKLTRLTLPESIAYIMKNSLNNLASLESLYCKKQIPLPPSESSSDPGVFAIYDGDGSGLITCAFDGIDTDNCILYVPTGCADSYRNATAWNYFLNIEEYDFTQTGLNETELKSDKPADVYNLLGVKVLSNVLPSEANSLLPSGIYIIGNKKMLVK